ncbi:MAG TPA: cation transporting ATPase C-terminal domain-containing protein, partial [Roseiarcus sp.]|nr:cation transporting ATPase C-terminal domain-containing protein [Roseiarcus sp.]
TAPQVLWVNMVTSVALGLVISFEPHETDVMRRPPRAIDRPIVTPFGMWRILFVGAALVVYTLAAFFWMKNYGASDGMARTAAVNAITLGQIFYLLNSRYLLDSSLSPSAHAGNPYLWYGVGAVIVLQLLFTYAPPFHAIFGNESLPLWAWPPLIGGGIVFFLVVEFEKLIIRSMPVLRRRATQLNEGATAATS